MVFRSSANHSYDHSRECSAAEKQMDASNVFGKVIELLIT